MSELYCIYQGPVVDNGVRYGGPVNMRTRQGFAVIAFGTADLAEYFASVFKQAGVVIPLSELGGDAYPFNPKPPLPRPKRKILLATKGILSAWAADRENFDTAPHLSPFEPKP